MLYQPALYNLKLSVIIEIKGERLQSNNLYINNSRVFIFKRKVIMCIKCKEDSYISYSCSNLKLLKEK